MIDIKQYMKTIQEQTFKIEVQVEEGGKMPSKAHMNDAGFDVYSTEDIYLLPGQVKKIPLNIRFKLPMSSWAEITTKSGLGSQGHLVYAGVIDQDYRGIVHVIMTNVNLIEGLDADGIPLMRTKPIIINKGDKVAQLIMSPYSNQFYMESVDSIDTNTSRGEGGFGSSGSK